MLRFEIRRASVILAGISVWLSLALAAQMYVSSRTLEGTVKAEDGKPLQAAVVKIENTTTLRIRSFITDAEGKYYFHGLQADSTYQLTAEHDGYQKKSQEVSKFNTDNPVVIDFHLSKQ